MSATLTPGAARFEPSAAAVPAPSSVQSVQSVQSPLAELAKRAAAGDEVATAELLRQLAPRIAVTVRAVLGAAHPDRDDAVQHALIGLVRALPAFRGDCEPAGYARVIAVRAAVALRKRERARRTHDDPTDVDETPQPCPLPHQVASSHQRQRLLRDLIADLPPEQADVLALRIVLGLSLEEVAAHVGAPVNTVRSRVRLAKERLRSRIEADPRLLEALGDAPSGDSSR